MIIVVLVVFIAYLAFGAGVALASYLHAKELGQHPERDAVVVAPILVVAWPAVLYRYGRS